jgi:hypothetical protein
MEERVLINYLREEGYRSRQIHSELVKYYETRHSLILMSAIRCDSFAWHEKALKIRDAAEDRQISKLISESREHSKIRPMIQLETLLRLPALPSQPYSISSLKFFIWNFVIGGKSSTNWATSRKEQEYNLLLCCRPSLKGHNGGAGRIYPLVMRPGDYGNISRKDIGWVWTRGSQTGSSKYLGREINIDNFFNPNRFAIVDLLR